MKAVIQKTYGTLEVLEYGDVERPIPKTNEVLVKVHAASINAGNLFSISGKPVIARLSTGFFKPKNLNPGSDVAGVVENTGLDVERFKPGDAVFGDNLLAGAGTFAEYVCVPEKELAFKPSNISFDEAAAVPQAALVALQGLRDVGGIEAGQQVLITGASGGNGTFAVQIAKAFGAVVTAVCSTRNIELVSSLGADQIIDYTKEDFAASGEMYDLIIAMGGYRSLDDYEKALLSGGTFVWAGGDLKGLFETMLKGSSVGRKKKKKMTNLSHKQNLADLELIAGLMAEGKIKPVIDSTFPLEETAEAFRHYKDGHMQGKVIINVVSED